jgi:hypothetical protein
MFVAKISVSLSVKINAFVKNLRSNKQAKKSSYSSNTQACNQKVFCRGLQELVFKQQLTQNNMAEL